MAIFTGIYVEDFRPSWVQVSLFSLDYRFNYYLCQTMIFFSYSVPSIICILDSFSTFHFSYFICDFFLVFFFISISFYWLLSCLPFMSFIRFSLEYILSEGPHKLFFISKMFLIIFPEFNRSSLHFFPFLVLISEFLILLFKNISEFLCEELKF